jgi:hypothetical protein
MGKEIHEITKFTEWKKEATKILPKTIQKHYPRMKCVKILDFMGTNSLSFT